MRYTKHYIIFISMALCLTGCGFKLRGFANFPPQLKTLYVSSNKPYSPLARDLKTRLRQSNITIPASQKSSHFTLAILNSNVGASQISIGSSQQMRNYNVSCSVSYVIQDKMGQQIVGPLGASASETVLLQANEMIENSSKYRDAKRDLRAQVISQMMFQLSSKNTAKKLNIAYPMRLPQSTQHQTQRVIHHKNTGQTSQADQSSRKS